MKLTKDKIQAEYNEALQRLEWRQSVLALLPVTPDDINHYVKSLPPTISYKCKGINGALEIYRAYTDHIIPSVYASNGTFAAVRPPQCLSKDYNNIKRDNILLSLTTDNPGTYGVSAKIEFYVILDGTVYEIDCSIEGPDYIGCYNRFMPVKEVIRNARGKIIKTKYNANPLLINTSDNCISWYDARYEYLFRTESAIKRLEELE